jgi:hypothetical protein
MINNSSRLLDKHPMRQYSLCWLTVAALLAFTSGVPGMGNIDPRQSDIRVAPADCSVTSGEIKPGKYSGQLPFTREVGKFHQVGTFDITLIVSPAGTITGTWNEHGALTQPSVTQGARFSGEISQHDGTVTGTTKSLHLDGGKGFIFLNYLLANFLYPIDNGVVQTPNGSTPRTRDVTIDSVTCSRVSGIVSDPRDGALGRWTGTKIGDCDQPGGTHISVHNDSFIVKGSTIQDAIEDAARQGGPSGEAGSVTPKILPYTPCLDKAGNVKSITIEIIEEEKIPGARAEKAQAPQAIQELWDKWRAAVEVHENKHVAIDQTGFMNLDQQGVGKSEIGAVKAINKIIDNTDKKNKDLDLTEGCVALLNSQVVIKPAPCQ